MAFPLWPPLPISDADSNEGHGRNSLCFNHLGHLVGCWKFPPQRRSGRRFRRCLRRPSAKLVTAEANSTGNVSMDCTRPTPVYKPCALSLFAVSVFQCSRDHTHKQKHSHTNTNTLQSSTLRCCNALCSRHIPVLTDKATHPYLPIQTLDT